MRRGGSYLGDKAQCYNHSVPGGMSDGIAGRSQPIIGNVQALRAIAALMVATMHAFAVQAQADHFKFFAMHRCFLFQTATPFRLYLYF